MEAQQGDCVTVALTPRQAEDLCWAYCGHRPAQKSEHTEDAINKFRIAARMGGGSNEAGSVRVTLPREEAEAMGFDGDENLVQRVLDRINEVL
jgi:hypothetical protein